MDLMSDLNVVVDEVQGQVPIAILHLEGRINLSNSEKLENVAQELYRKGRRYLIVDLSSVPSITSAGLRAILYIYKLFETGSAQSSSMAPQGSSGEGAARSSHLKISAPSAEVLKVLKVSGFDRYLDIYADRQAAVDAFEGERG